MIISWDKGWSPIPVLSYFDRAICIYLVLYVGNTILLISLSFEDQLGFLDRVGDVCEHGVQRRSIFVGRYAKVLWNCAAGNSLAVEASKSHVLQFAGLSI